MEAVTAFGPDSPLCFSAQVKAVRLFYFLANAGGDTLHIFMGDLPKNKEN